MIEDDIVVKLRVSTVADSAANIYETMTMAADEIERLRYELSVQKRVGFFKGCIWRRATTARLYGVRE